MINSGRTAVSSFLAAQRNILVSGFSSLALRLAGLASTFLLGVVLARVLGPAGYGVYGLVISLSALAMNIALLGTPQLAVREMAVRSARNDWAAARSLWITFLKATTLASAVIGLAAVAAAALFAGDRPDVVLYAFLGSLLSALMTVIALIAAELRGLGAMFKGQFMDIFGRPAAAFVITGALLLAYGRIDVISALAIQLIVALVAAMVSLAWIRQALPVRIASLGPERGWLKAALPLGVVDILRQFDGTYGLILLGLLGTATELGIYRVAIGASVLVSMPVTILHIVLAPNVSRHHRFGEREELQRLLRLASASMVAIIVPMLIVLIFFGRPLVELVFGQAYGDAWIPLALLCVAQLVMGFFGMGPILLAMAESERRLTVIYIASVTVGAAIAALTIPRFGAVGAAGAQIVSTALVAILSNRTARIRLGLGTTFLATTTSPPAS